LKRVFLRQLPASTAALEHNSLVELDRKEVRVVVRSAAKGRLAPPGGRRGYGAK
jgi:hypothetical protein